MVWMKTAQDTGTVQYCMEKQVREEKEERLPGVRTNTAVAMRKLLGFISSASAYSKIQMFFSFSLCGPI